MAVQLPKFGHGGYVHSGFDWDAGNVEKCRAHGLTQAIIEGVFDGEVAVHPDPVHSASEVRFIAIGAAGGERFVFCVFTLRRRAGGELIRPISARYMHRKEVAYYEKVIASIEHGPGGRSLRGGGGPYRI